MAQRGRKSSEATAMTTFQVATAVERPDAPYELTDEQAEVWRRVVDARPADHFTPETWGDLVNYCAHEVTARRIRHLIAEHEASEEFDVGIYDKLLKMQERESRAMASLSIRLRIAPSASASKNKDLKVTTAKKPWQR